MKIRAMIEIKLENNLINYGDDEERMWLENEILIGDGQLIIHSNEIGDTVGTVTKLKGLSWLEKE